MLVPLVNFSSSFRFRVRQSCAAAVSLRLSQSKPACTRLSACRRHSCLTAAYHRLLLPAAGCPSRRAPLVLVPVLLPLPLACSAAECCHHICCSFSAWRAQEHAATALCCASKPTVQQHRDLDCKNGPKKHFLSENIS